MKLCDKCNSDTLYLGKGKAPLNIGLVYTYICVTCNNIMWQTFKEKSKYKWYKFDKEKLRKMIKGE